MSASLTIAIFVESPTLLPSVSKALGEGRYVLRFFSDSGEFVHCVEGTKQEIDCLVVQAEDFGRAAVGQLHGQGIVLPTVFLMAPGEDSEPQTVYHFSEVFLSMADLADLEKAVEEAIAKFLNLSQIDPVAEALAPADVEVDTNIFLLSQQRRLSEKLKERLGYLAVYYNRNSQHFFRHLSATERDQLSVQLQESYRRIVLSYFAPDSKINDLLDEFVTLVFFADLSVSDVVEIHMDLMDDFSKQLKMEGWSEDILLDYRLTLIDVIAHLCEMYRRSVPRERG